jgi:FOG: FHA domain
MEVRNGAFSERNYLNGTFLAGDFNETGFRLMQQNVGETAYLVADMGQQLSEDTFALKMMAHNHMVNIIETQIAQRDERRLVQFNITGLIKLSGWLARPHIKKDVLALFNSLVNAFEEVDAYMLDMERLLLDWEYVYLDRQGNCMLLYLPFDHMFRKGQIAFLQEIVGRVQQDYQERDTYLFDILNAFSRGGIRKLSDFREILKRSAGVPATSLDWNAPPKAPATAVQEKIGMAKFQPQEMGRNVVSREEQKDVSKKAPSGSRIPVVNIPGREPGGKAATREKEAMGIGMEPEKEEKEKKDTEKKASKKEGKKSLFKREGKKQAASQKKGIFQKQNGLEKHNEFQKQNAFLMPGKQKAGLPEDAAGEGRMQSGINASAKSMALGQPDGLYESYENTVMMPEPANIMQGNGQVGGYAQMPGGMGALVCQGDNMGAGQTLQTGMATMEQGNGMGIMPAGIPATGQGNMQAGWTGVPLYANPNASMGSNLNINPYAAYAADMDMRGNAAGMQEEECTMMIEQPQFQVRQTACLIRRRDGAAYRMEREQAMVGSGMAADICIHDNHAISRNHAILLCINGEYYLEDNQSKNGSFINGRRIQPGVREVLYDGMVLKFADEDFVFSKHGR